MTNHTSVILGIWEWGGSSDKFRSLRMAGKGQNGRKSEMEYSPWNCQGSGKQKPSIFDPGPTWVGPTQNFTAAVGSQDKSPQSRDWETVPPKLPVNWDSTGLRCSKIPISMRYVPRLVESCWIRARDKSWNKISVIVTTFLYILFMWNLMFACHKPTVFWW